MQFPDQVHINQVRDALWRRPTSRASVMVGAGFSQNAKKRAVDASEFPSWRSITRKICSELYPNNDARFRRAIEEASATSGFLKLSQEYETAFGPNALRLFVKSEIPDDQYKPGDAHVRLLRLPWRDVFTTNWDTLLEKSRTVVTERVYSVVYNVDDIASTSSPRIVKLHGSLPSHYPLIFTEEDYRTYPNRFAPFVSTVQQAMMETVFLLVGFSGDDPNFLHWSGWVRDNMGASAPSIYLAGWLNLSSHRRQMLNERNVIPIDLANHPQAHCWPEHQKHEYATAWVLHTLELGRPYDITEWPTPRKRQQVDVVDVLRPVDVPAFGEPKEEPQFPSSNDEPVSVETVLKLIHVWKHNRSKYPGWLTLPGARRHRLRGSTEKWEPEILRILPELDIIDRLRVIDELVWRHEIVLEPISDALERAATDTITAIDCQCRTVGGDESPDVPWSNVRLAWGRVALVLATTARQRYNRVQFERWVAALSPFVDDHEDVSQQVHYEKVLWALYSLDFSSVDAQLDTWQTDASDPVWMLRKAAMLVECRRTDEARQLTSRALAEIRKAPEDRGSLGGPSREGWSLFMVATLERRSTELPNLEARSRHYQRWRELGAVLCDALEEKSLCAEALLDRPTDEKPVFDLGVRTEGVSYRSAARRELEARRALWLTEVAGFPAAAGSKDILKRAAEALVPSEPLLASLLVLRICDYDGDGVLMRVFARMRVAALPDNAVDVVGRCCSQCIDYSVSRIRGPEASAWVDRLRVALEILSRLVLRKQPDKVEEILDTALDFYSNRSMAGNRLLTRPLRHLLMRCWEALPELNRTNRVLDLLSAPVVGLDGFEIGGAQHSHVDPGEIFLQHQPLLPPRTLENDDRWEDVVALLIRGLRAGGEARNRASLRIGLPGLCEQLTDDEKSRVADALWHHEYTEPDGLPGNTKLYDWAFLQLPEPGDGLAEQGFRRRWLDKGILERARQRENATTRKISFGPVVPHAGSLDGVIGQIGIALGEMKRLEDAILFSDDECQLISDFVNEWCDMGIPPIIRGLRGESSKFTSYAITGLASILLEVPISESLAEKLLDKLGDLHESKIPAYGLVAGLVRILPGRLEDLVMVLRTGLVSDDIYFAESAAAGLFTWLQATADASRGLPPPPDDLIREIGVAIATRRKGMLDQALQIAEWILAEGRAEQKETIRGLSVQGLRFLIEELRYDRHYDREGEDVDVPTLRWRCASLAVTLAKLGSEDPAVAAWMEAIGDDPLPEVRYTKPIDYAPRADDR